MYIEQDRGHLLSLHNAIATKNPLGEKIYSFILEYFEFSIQKTHESPENRANVLRLHREIVEALESRDVERIVDIIKKSIVDWIKRTVTQ